MAGTTLRSLGCAVYLGCKQSVLWAGFVITNLPFTLVAVIDDAAYGCSRQFTLWLSLWTTTVVAIAYPSTTPVSTASQILFVIFLPLERGYDPDQKRRACVADLFQG